MRTKASFYDDLIDLFDTSQTKILCDVFSSKALKIKVIHDANDIETLCRRFEKSTDSIMSSCVGALDGMLQSVNCP